jgi:uncharacterized protein (DUF2345 family)
VRPLTVIVRQPTSRYSGAVVASRVLELQHGRTLRVEQALDEDVVEVRSSRGALELRLRCTEDGVVLQFEGARISLLAQESVDVECASFNVNASSGITLEAGADVRARGERIYLN